MFEWLCLVALIISEFVHNYQMNSITQKIKDLENEHWVLKYSMERDQDDLRMSLSSVERSIECLEGKLDRIKSEDIHDIKDEISFLRSWLKNVGKIATSTRDKLNSSVGN